MKRTSKDFSNRNHLKALSAIRGKGSLVQDLSLLHNTEEEMTEKSKTLGKELKGLGVGVMNEEGMIRRV